VRARAAASRSAYVAAAGLTTFSFLASQARQEEEPGAVAREVREEVVLGRSSSARDEEDMVLVETRLFFFLSRNRGTKKPNDVIVEIMCARSSVSSLPDTFSPSPFLSVGGPEESLDQQGVSRVLQASP